MDIWSHPDKNKHPQDSDVMPMINGDKEGSEDVLCYNDVMRKQEEVFNVKENIG